MPRWNPDAHDRLVAAAIELFRERGYEAVTISDIAERAGLTRRSFFRHFPDKREVLFAGSAANTAEITAAMGRVGAEVGVRETVMGTLVEVGEFLLRDPGAQALRQELIDSSAELQERERTKLASIGAALAAGLVARGIAEVEARTIGAVAAEVFHSAYLEAVRAPRSGGFAERLETAAGAAGRLLGG